MIEIDYVTAPSAWASYLINGDASGLDDHDKRAADCLLGQLAPFPIVDVKRDKSGEPEPERFTTFYRIHGGNADAGNVTEFVLHRWDCGKMIA